LHPAQVSAVSDEPISLALRADLSVVLGNRVIAREYLAQELETATGGNKNTQIFLRVDPEVSYADFSKLLGPLHAAGYGRISIVTPAVASAPPPNPVSPDNITDEKAALAREFAALTPAPKVAIATEAKPSATGGECHANPYLCTLFGLIMRQQHYPDEAKAQHIEGTVAVAFWVDDRGNLMHLALYRTSGHPILDDEAVASIRRAAPFPPPPPGIPHGFISQMQFPPK
jgi:TonB family protein